MKSNTGANKKRIRNIWPYLNSFNNGQELFITTPRLENNVERLLEIGFNEEKLYLLESIGEGDTTYVLRDDWETLSRLTRKDKYVGALEMGNGIWRVFYRNVFLGYFDKDELKTKEKSVRLETNLV